MRSGLFAFALLVMTAPSWAADFLVPDPALSPSEVVAMQLTALHANDTPQGRASVSQAVDRVRQAAKQRKKEWFTALFHHLSVAAEQQLTPAFLPLADGGARGS